MLWAVLVRPLRWPQEKSHPLMPPLLLSVQLWIPSHHNPLCSFWWHICRKKELIRLFCLALWTRSGHQLLTTAVSTTLGLSFPIPLPLLWMLSDTQQPPTGLPAVRSSGTDSEENLGSTFQLARIPRLPFFNKNEQQKTFHQEITFFFGWIYALSKFSRT